MHAKESITNVYLTDSVFASGFEAHEVPVHRWSFESDASDSIGGADGTLVNGALVVDSGTLTWKKPGKVLINNR